MSTPQSNIRVFIQWKEQTIFAGEDIECQITFKNVATTQVSTKPSLQSRTSNGFIQSAERHRRAPSQIKNSALSPRSVLPDRGHRSSLSLTVPPESVHSKQSEPWHRGLPSRQKGGESHKRSLSIISMGASESAVDEAASHGSLVERPGRGGNGHGRSSSLHIVPRRNGVNGGPISAPLSSRLPLQHSPLIGSSFPPNQYVPNPPRRHTGTSTGPSSPGPGPHYARRKDSAQLAPNFKFPAVSSPTVELEENPHFEVDQTSHKHQESNKGLLSPRSRDTVSSNTDHIAPAPIARILSPSSMGGTPRSSGEFYSLSNNSTETLASEYFPPQQARMPPYSGHHVKRSSNLAPTNNHKPPETLMMGYAQIHGSFTLDPSLISQAPFEEVKRKGIVGGHGGGVIGLEQNKRDSSLLRTFGWGTLGESIGGLLGGGELSTMKDMRGMANSRSIPLLSTPQSILFVDLRLAPGESRNYKYSFKLPRGLPPSHRGKAIKTSYKLVIGVQRPGGAREQQVRSVEIPFRLLGSVNSYGELLGHDLMLPHILLRDQARIQSISTKSSESLDLLKKLSIDVSKTQKSKDSNLDDFLAYVDQLLTRPRRSSSFGLLSPTETISSRRHSVVEEPATAKEAIDMAILRSNMSGESQQSANRFEIARSGKRVAVVMLARPAYRLGETITAAIDFTNAGIPCYAVHAALETSEKVDQSIALRSEASIFRVTRRVHVSHSESTLFARRITFSPTIPLSATPEFITSGVSLDWRIRIEFVTPRLSTTVDGEIVDLEPELLEEYTNDERGVVFAAVQGLECESFEIAVPIRVYGAAVSAGDLGGIEQGEGPGLIV